MSISPPRPKGPPLNALRAFEVAADWAGAALFDRRSQGVSLTELGKCVAAEFSTAFDAIGV